MTTKKHYANKIPRRCYGYGDTDSSCHNPNLPKSLPIIGLGCSSFSTAFIHDTTCIPHLTYPPSREHPLVLPWVETIHHAVLNCGINYLDTAPWYGQGISEAVIGYSMDELLRQVPREDLVINTKVGRYDADPMHMFDFSAQRVRSSVLTSIERMKCSYIDVLQLHDPEFAEDNLELLVEETIPALIRLRDVDKLVKAIGMTGYSLRVQKELLHRTYERYGVTFDQSLTYCHYNLHDQSLFQSSSDNAPSFATYCKQHAIGLIAAAPLSMGLLTQQSNPPLWHPAPKALKHACKEAAEYCAKKQVNLSTIALLFALGQEKIPCTILGMKDIDEVDNAMEVACRFVDKTNDRLMLNLSHVLTENEKQVLDYLLDKESNGPFAKVFKSGEYEWEGVEVENFKKTLLECAQVDKTGKR